MPIHLMHLHVGEVLVCFIFYISCSGRSVTLRSFVIFFVSLALHTKVANLVSRVAEQCFCYVCVTCGVSPITLYFLLLFLVCIL
jgi:hypothetical protein